ncbi:hypothetical protein BGW36DRAFT_371149 [Talaromyces proteolyticus]|uniref:Zn(2)-C6 fungal-type domain-containing protein n=1 Tax=Talaromyces proteolyticus TaxID=1131652 RepID=A0AAD4Q3B2_9EURO|nr:uncharacterized protein BGW36DRAFT_371149 [Talaromyces proteolyticus]KAH8701587.1 hypothetical protein BGW36DRAFT_371149 [Talaromyces proteolyticus]
MKRSFEAAEDQRNKQARRQDPISCQFCRAKKLKCDRLFPCSNCRARKLNCISSTSTSRGTAHGRKIADSSSASRSDLSRNLDDLNGRLKRVEELLASSNASLPRNIEPEPVSYKQEPLGDDLESMRSMSVAEVDAFQRQSFDSSCVSSYERIGHIFSVSFLTFNNPAHRPALDQEVLSLLPSRMQAVSLLDFYIANIIPFYHIIHTPTIQKMLNTAYTQLEIGQQPPDDHVALLSAIFAIAAFFGPRPSPHDFDAKGIDEYIYQLIFVAHRALLAANYINQPTLETLQTIIMIALYILPHIGEMETSKLLMNSALLGAQSLSLHQLDRAVNKKQREKASVDWVVIEVKRRIWWHLASTEWMSGYMSGPRCGTYMIDPKHMQVELPTNVDDMDINPSGVYGRPFGDVPTDMTYYLLRIKLAVIIREIVDAANNCECHPDDLPYDLVLFFDKKINETIIDCLPMIDPKNRKHDLRDEGSDKKFSNLPLLRLMGEFCPQTKLTRLHRPYLARGARIPKYAYSRMICLSSARKTIELGKKIMSLESEFEPIRMWTIIHHLFASVLVLVMDYSLNREEPRADERKAEILECFNWLEISQGNSIFAKEALRQLRYLLPKGATKSDGEQRVDSYTPQQGNTSVCLPFLQNHVLHQVGELPSGTSVPHFASRLPISPGQEVIDPLLQYNGDTVDFTTIDSIDAHIDLDEIEFASLFERIEESQLTY